MKYSPQATIRLEEGDLFQALLKECKKIEDDPSLNPLSRVK